MSLESTATAKLLQICNFIVADPTALPGGTFGQGSVPILVTDFRCSGSEQSLYTGCSYSTSVDCSHLNDAAVSCPAPTGPCSNGSVRVMGGGSAYEGEVQVCLNQDWVSVCDSDWSDNEASVVCQQLGFSGIGMDFFCAILEQNI